jgi:hypothetical protein
MCTFLTCNVSVAHSSKYDYYAELHFTVMPKDYVRQRPDNSETPRHKVVNLKRVKQHFLNLTQG